MAITGIIAEFNPFHIGHKHLLDFAKENGDAVACVISGNFVQRGDVALLPKQKRAETALRCGADLVAELPVYWSMSTAQNFALGGISQLAALGCDRIVFGSETGDLDALQNAAKILDGDRIKVPLAAYLKEGLPFAAARERAARDCGLQTDVLQNPNDTLGIEYILAAKRLELPLTFACLKRTGSAHDSLQIDPNIVSSALLRKHLLANDIGFAEKFMPLALRGKIPTEQIADIRRIEPAILAVLRLKTQADFAALPDLSEGLENKLFFAVKRATALEELLTSAKSKRYSLARIRRLVLSAFLGLDNTQFGLRPPYVRVLGCNEIGEKLLQNRDGCDIPIVTKATAISPLGANAEKVFAAECRATDLFALAQRSPQECGSEFKTKFLRTECLP